VGDLPWFAFDPAACKFEVFPGNQRYCTVERSDAIDTMRKVRPILEAVTTELDIPLVPIRDAFCDRDHCSMVHDGVIMFRDSNHLNISGSNTVGSMVAAYLQEMLSTSASP
jgi:hypothetical protein